MDYLERAKRVIEIELREAAAVAHRLDSRFVQAVELLKKTVEQRGKIVILGVGKSGHIGEKIAATLTSTGSPAVVLNSLNALHGDLGVVSDGDAILALSYSGETQELLSILPAFVRWSLPIVAITGNATSTLAQSAMVVLDVAVSQEACPLNLAPTSSTTAMLVVGDALAMALLEARGFGREDFAKFHPGGSLGRELLLRVHQIMRSGERLATVDETVSVLEAVQKMTACRAGAAIVLNADGRLAGIFTHGDFARHYQENPAVGEVPIGRVMTPQPVSVRSDALAAEALRILETHRIDDLVVLDADGRPVGMLDSQDVTRLRMF